MTSSEGVIGSVGAAPVAPSAGMSLSVAGKAPVGVKDSFAEIMRQSSQVNAVKAETTAPAPDKTEALTSLKQVKIQPAHGNGENEVDTTAYAESNLAATGASVKSAVVNLTKTAAVETESGTANAEAVMVPLTSVASAKALVSFVPVVISSPIIEKPPMENREKAKTTAAVKTSAHSEGKNFQNTDASIANNSGGDVAATSQNVVADSATPSSDMPVATQSYVAIASLSTSAVDGKSTKGNTSQVVSAPAVEPATASSLAITDVSAAANGITGAASPGTPNGIVLPAMIQSGVEQTATALSTHIYPTQSQGINLVPAGSASHPLQSGSVANRNQTSGTNDLIVSTYDASKSNQLEVGLQGGGFGSLKVRAELTGAGEVNAYLRGSSMDSTGLLQMQAPKIEAYLGTHDVVVRSVQVETTQTHLLSAGLGGDGGAAADGGASQRQSGRSSQQSNTGTAAPTNADASSEAAMPVQMVSRQNSIAMTETGNWLSVRA